MPPTKKVRSDFPQKDDTVYCAYFCKYGGLAVESNTVSAVSPTRVYLKEDREAFGSASFVSKGDYRLQPSRRAAIQWLAGWAAANVTDMVESLAVAKHRLLAAQSALAAEGAK